jgi:hypothetical protein
MVMNVRAELSMNINIRAILLFTSISSRLSLLFEEKVEHRFEYYSLVYAPTKLQ